MAQREETHGPAPEAQEEFASPTTTVHTGYVTAQHIQRERDLRKVMKNAIDIAELSGDLFFYRWEVSSADQSTGKKKPSFICGPSVKLTNEATRLFGNCVIQQKPVQSTHNAWIFTSAFIDLETGFTRERQFRMSKKFPVHGRMDRFRKDDIRFQIGQSKSDRNVALNALPQILTDKMLKAALASVRTQIQTKVNDVFGGNIQRAISEFGEAFKEFGIEIGLIEEKLGIKRKVWDLDTLVMLAGDLKALKHGEHTKDTLYSLDETEDDSGGENTQSTSKKDGLSVDKMTSGNAADHQSVKGRDEDKPVADKSTKDELIARLFDLSEAKEKIVSLKDRTRLVEIAQKMGGWDNTILGACIREVEGMKAVRKPPKTEDDEDKMDVT